MRRLLFAACLVTCATASNAAEQESTLAYAYSKCAACHLPDGAGVPGAFPPLKDRSAQIAALDGGREYLITVVSFGLMGTLDIGGMQYFGIMPGNKSTMTEEEIADVLNYAIFELGDDADTDGIEPISADEVSEVQAKTTDTGPAGAAQLRETFIESAGDKWVD